MRPQGQPGDRRGDDRPRAEQARRTAGYRAGGEAATERAYDPRREARRQLARVPLPDDVAAQELDAEVRSDLLSLSKETADLVARHLVMTGRLLDDDPPQALAHARAAGALAGRVGAVREAVGIAGYHAGEWADALSELRAARRITGRADHLAVMADCERALGRPERALAVYDDPAVRTLDQALRVELAIVVAGARRDLGQPEAAVLLLQGPARATRAVRPWAARLWYAFADSLLDAGRADEAREWFAKAAEVDEAGETDAPDRLLALEGVVFGEEGAAEDDEETEHPEAPVGHDAEALLELASSVVPFDRTPVAAPPSEAAPEADGPVAGGTAAPSAGVRSARGAASTASTAADEQPQSRPPGSPFAAPGAEPRPPQESGRMASRPHVAPVSFVAADAEPEDDRGPGGQADEADGVDQGGLPDR